eukprot:2652020-Heterocapsa_arctica.AAC.1
MEMLKVRAMVSKVCDCTDSSRVAYMPMPTAKTQPHIRVRITGIAETSSAQSLHRPSPCE